MFLISSICYGIDALIALFFGVTYLTRSQFMPYHSLALAKPWSEVESDTQTLILALMRVAGGGFIATGIAIIVLLCIPFQAREQWAIYSVFLICFCNSFSSSYATFLVQHNTPGNPPWKLSLGAVFLSLVGFFCSLV